MPFAITLSGVEMAVAAVTLAMGAAKAILVAYRFIREAMRK